MIYKLLSNVQNEFFKLVSYVTDLMWPINDELPGTCERAINYIFPLSISIGTCYTDPDHLAGAVEVIGRQCRPTHMKALVLLTHHC
jgi:hypothetical protein